jgi:hypothetical protein
MRTTIFKMLGAITAFVASLVSVNAQMSPVNIEVSYVKGRVHIMDNEGNQSRAKVGKIFQEGTEITTGVKGQIKVIFANGTRMVIEPDSQVQIGDFKMTRNAKTLDSGFAKLSTVREPTNSHTHIILTKGNLLFEVPPLNLPLSLFRLDCPYFGAEVKGTVFRFEQGLDFGRMSVYKGKVRSFPKYEEFGPDIEVPEGKMVYYRFRKKPLYDDIRDPLEEKNAGDELIDPPPNGLPSDPDDEDSLVPIPTIKIPEDPIDVSLIEDVSLDTRIGSKENGEGTTIAKPKK